MLLLLSTIIIFLRFVARRIRLSWEQITISQHQLVATSTHIYASQWHAQLASTANCASNRNYKFAKLMPKHIWLADQTGSRYKRHSGYHSNCEPFERKRKGSGRGKRNSWHTVLLRIDSFTILRGRDRERDVFELRASAETVSGA